MALLQEFFAEMFRGHGQQLAFVGRLSASFGRDLLGRNIRAVFNMGGHLQQDKKDGNPIQVSTVVQTCKLYRNLQNILEYLWLKYAQIIKIQSYVYTAVYL